MSGSLFFVLLLLSTQVRCTFLATLLCYSTDRQLEEVMHQETMLQQKAES